MRSECCFAKASTSGVTVRVCSVVKRMRSLPPASNSTIVLPQVPSPTTAALIMPVPSRSYLAIYLGHVSMARTMQVSIQNTQYSMPPITQIHFLVTL